jgi:thiamine biosynthesis protein ThiS
MKITLNNRPESLDRESLTIQELLEVKNFTFKLLVTKINGKLVKKDERASALVKDGDDVTVLHLISGG